MQLKKFFSRKKQDVEIAILDQMENIENCIIICDTQEIKDSIMEWTKKEEWRFKNFTNFLEFIGVKFPIKLNSVEGNSVTGINVKKEQIKITFIFADSINDWSEIWVTEGEETRQYTEVNAYEITDTREGLVLKSREIRKNGKKLNSYYGNYSCYRTLRLDVNHILRIEVEEPRKDEVKNHSYVLQNCETIENYILGLDNSLDIVNVYNTILKFLNFSEYDLKKTEKILISYVEIIDEKEKDLNKILVNYGKVQEYSIFKNEEHFHIFREGNWKYSSRNVRINYIEKEKCHEFLIIGNEKEVINVSPKDTVYRVKQKISEMWEFIDGNTF